MAFDIVLFLHAAVPRAALLPALEQAFGMSLESADAPNDFADGAVALAEYAEGFAVGVGITAGLPPATPVRCAVQMLAELLKTDVLLENAEPQDRLSRWLLLSPGTDLARPMQVIELRHGLAVAPVEGLPVQRSALLA